MKQKLDKSLVGLWVNPAGEACLCLADGLNTRTTQKLPLNPFVWLADPHPRSESLQGSGQFTHLLQFEELADCEQFLDQEKSDYDTYLIKPWETQFLLDNQLRFFNDLPLTHLRRLQCDIETASSTDSMSNPKLAEDRILAIGFRFQGQNEILELQSFDAAGEKALLEAFEAKLHEYDPDTIEGHNFFNFDLNYIKTRCQRYKLKLTWGRFEGLASTRSSRLKVAERWVDFTRFDIPGRTVFDTYLMVQLFDLTKRELVSYGLKAIARQLGFSQESNRTYLDGGSMKSIFENDRASFRAYLEDDLRETEALANLLLPTYFAQVQNFPLTLQESMLRGNGTKLDLMLVEKYFHAKTSLPEPSSIASFAGGFTKSFETGVYKHILHYDVASLYPSLMLHLNENPESDTLGCFLGLLSELRQYRLTYKQKAKEATDPHLKAEYDARQNSFKILINSFYGYLGFEGGRFADSDLASKITALGRELLQKLIEGFQQAGAQVLEADTDGIYLSSESFFDNPEALLEKVQHLLPEGVNLEYDGSYESMFCYKAKNYALYDGKQAIVKGSGMRSRGMEPFVRKLTSHLIDELLGAPVDQSTASLYRHYQSQIETAALPIDELAKIETLSQSPARYLTAVEQKKTPRRAALEVATKMDPLPKLGDKIKLFMGLTGTKRAPDWQRAQHFKDYHPETNPYDPTYYLKRLNDWKKRYNEFLDLPT